MKASNLVSVVVLKEGRINQQCPIEAPLFEESIYIIDLAMAGKTKGQLLTEIKEKLQIIEIRYPNAFDKEIQWKICKIIDIFDNIYDLSVTQLPNEVYSRHLPLAENTTLQHVLERFYADYVWEDAAN